MHFLYGFVTNLKGWHIAYILYSVRCVPPPLPFLPPPNTRDRIRTGEILESPLHRTEMWKSLYLLFHAHSVLPHSSSFYHFHPTPVLESAIKGIQTSIWNFKLKRAGIKILARTNLQKKSPGTGTQYDQFNMFNMCYII